ncbi:hypothetical protein DL769_005904 [Monosporascus sp. CRB-8-3]|nr:hypothetical protein DL769_005904 [Monosporascus sp. CRB-8-3]
MAPTSPIGATSTAIPIATPTVFVSGATGNIGGALARELRQGLGWAVHATARDPESSRAQELKAMDVRLWRGDWDDVASLSAAMDGCDKLFICTATYVDDPGRERVHAENLVRAARAAGCIRQVVVSSSIGVFTYDGSGNSHRHSIFFDRVMAAKEAGEQAVSTSGSGGEADWRWTLLRPALFMTNFLAPQVDYFSPGFRADGVWRSTMTAESRLALVEPADIARVAAVVMKHADNFHGRALGVAGDVLTVQEALKQLGNVTGRSYQPYFMSEEEIDKQKESLCFTIAERSLRFMADNVDLQELTSMTRLTSFKEFLNREEELVKEAYL